VVRREGGFEIFMHEHREGAPLILLYESLERVNRFLELLSLPTPSSINVPRSEPQHGIKRIHRVRGTLWAPAL